MIKFVNITLVIVSALLCQVTLFPAFLEDPFQPNLLIILVAYLGLRLPTHLLAALGAFLLGLVQDSVSGLYLGLCAFSYLAIFLLLGKISDRLYTDNRYLIILVVFLTTIASGLLNLLLLLIFSASQGIYATLVPALIPQALVNALVASLLFAPSSAPVEERR
jgi:rod shape-determining protein MreD